MASVRIASVRMNSVRMASARMANVVMTRGVKLSTWHSAWHTKVLVGYPELGDVKERS